VGGWKLWQKGLGVYVKGWQGRAGPRGGKENPGVGLGSTPGGGEGTLGCKSRRWQRIQRIRQEREIITYSGFGICGGEVKALHWVKGGRVH